MSIKQLLYKVSLFLGGWIFSAQATEIPLEEVFLSPLNASEASVIGSNVRIRPYRKGGPRLEVEEIGSKKVYHNYGQGGAGASLAPGCVHKAIELFRQENPSQSQKITVLGAGYNGLFTALFLRRLGYDNINLVAEKFPEKDYLKGTPPITSLVAGGYWMPFGIDVPDNRLEEMKEIQTYSFNYYRSQIEMGEQKSLSFRKAYFVDEDTEVPHKDLAEGLIADPEDVNITFNGGKSFFPAKRIETILMDGNLLVNSLFEQIQDQGVTITQATIDSLEAIQQLEADVIFNCMGYGSKKVFADENLIPVRGQLLYLAPQPNVGYFLFANGIHGPFSMYPSDNKIAIGLTYEEGRDELEPEEQTLKRFRENVASFILATS